MIRQAPEVAVLFDMNGRFTVTKVRLHVLQQKESQTDVITLAAGADADTLEKIATSDDVANGWNDFAHLNQDLQFLRVDLKRAEDGRFITVSEIEIWGYPAVDQASDVQIAIDANAPKVTQFAAEELQAYLHRIAGARVPITARPRNGVAMTIHIGRSAHTDKLGANAADVGADGFILKRTGEHLLIVGDDRDVGSSHAFGFDPRVSRKGSYHGVCRLLEDHFGVRWLYPGEGGTVVPKREALSFPSKLDMHSAPKMAWRHLFLNYGDRLTPEQIEAGLRWTMRQRMGINVGSPYSFQHSWAYHMGGNSYFDEHPEYYSLVNGKRTPYPIGANGKTRSRGSQICTRNPDVVRIVAASITRGLSPDANTIVSVSPNDGGHFCQCEPCKAMDRPELYEAHQGHVANAGLAGHVLSDRLFDFVNRVASEVRKTHPDVKVGCFSYTFARPAPRALDHLAPNLVISFTQQMARYRRAPDATQRHNARLHEWLGKGNKLVLRDYLGLWSYGNVIAPQTRWIEKELRTAAEHPDQVLGIYSETVWTDLLVNALNYYVMARLAWDPSRSEAAIRFDYFEHGFGEASKTVEQFHELIAQAYARPADPMVTEIWGTDLWLTPDVASRGRSLLDQAGKQAQAQNVQARVDHLRDMFDYAVHVRSLFAALRALADHGLPIRLRGYAPRIQDHATDRATILTLIAQARASYDALTDAIDALEQDPDVPFTGSAFRHADSI